MNPEERSLLERTYKISKENNEILTSLLRRARIGTVIKSLYWFVIIGLSIGAFYFIQPTINFMMSSLGIGSEKSEVNSNISLTKDYVDTITDLLK